MRCTFLVLVALLKIGTLKTEPIDFVRKNGRQQEMIFSMGQSGGSNKMKDVTLHMMDMHNNMGEGIDDERDGWNDAGVRFQPIDAVYQKIANLDENGEFESEENDYADDQFKSIEQLDDAQLAHFSNYLVKLLQRPGVWEAPLILIKDAPENLDERPIPLEFDNMQNIAKRSRYYRRYPWKRQNSRFYNSMDYDPYNPCNPTRRDVFQLLVALHDARQGNKSRFVNFCNRRRPASAVFTNIRFLGRKRK